MLSGIWAGMHTVRYFDGKTYKWVGISRQPNIIGKVCSDFGASVQEVENWITLFGVEIHVLQYFLLCVIEIEESKVKGYICFIFKFY